MLAVTAYLVLALFLGGSLYILGLMFYLMLKKGRVKTKPLNPDTTKKMRMPKAA